ncbi:MAG: prepilin-type N-terminal cleavage/methylation domain-containing protein [Thermoguttaceae bacterium]
MKRPSTSLARRVRSHRETLGARAFTLVEMLVVITIIGILAGLTIPAVMMGVRHATNASVAMQMTELERACQAYKEKFGEYPPDFTGLDSSIPAVVQASRQAILQHLSNLFPRYQPASWNALATDVQNGWNLDINKASPSVALTFFLGGKPDWVLDNNGDPIPPGAPGFNETKPVKGFLGFSANQAAPFDNSPSRTGKFFEFDLTSLRCPVTAGTSGGIIMWPTKACDKNRPNTIVYFRADNGNYFCNGSNTTSQQALLKNCGFVYPAADSNLTTNYNFVTVNGIQTRLITWINSSSIQIICAGRDIAYSPLLNNRQTTPADPASDSPLKFPSGENYSANTFDDITNFSGGKLEDKIP